MKLTLIKRFTPKGVVYVVVLKQQQVEEMQELESYVTINQVTTGRNVSAPTNFEKLVESNLFNGIWNTYCDDVKYEDYEDKKGPELEEENGVFFVKLEGMIEELKMWKFDENYAREEKENTQGVEGTSEKEMIGNERKKSRASSMAMIHHAKGI
jgi:hypothetical protein